MAFTLVSRYDKKTILLEYHNMQEKEIIAIFNDKIVVKQDICMTCNFTAMCEHCFLIQLLQNLLFDSSTVPYHRSRRKLDGSL